MRKITVFTLGLFLAALWAAGGTLAAAPGTIDFQSKLTNAADQPVPNGTYSVKFRLYDAAIGGIPLWAETLNVSVAGGLFTVRLGEVHPLSASFFDSPSRWFGITVGADAELTPRTPLTSVPYALGTPGGPYLPLAGGTMTGPTIHDTACSIWKDSGHDRVVVSPTGNGYQFSGAQISTFGSDNQEQIRLWGGSWGELLLMDGSVSNYNTATLSAGFSGGGSLTLTDGTGNPTIYLNAGIAGDGSVQLPQNAIDANEILDEPGIAQGRGFGTGIGTASMTELASVTLTIPAAGYIVLDGNCFAFCEGTLGGNWAYVGIDENLANLPDGLHDVQYGAAGGFPNIGQFYYPVHASRVYFKSAGTYTFKLGAKAGAIGAGGSNTIASPTIRAMYMPTSYGSVATLVSSADAGQYPGATKLSPGSVATGMPHSASGAYQVDLRELEIKAAKAQAEAEHLQRRLLEARMKLESRMSGSGNN